MATDLTMRHKDIALLELLDRVLDKGVVVAGDLTISVANIDLIYVGLRLLICSVEKLEQGKVTPFIDQPTNLTAQPRAQQPKDLSPW